MHLHHCLFLKNYYKNIFWLPSLRVFPKLQSFFFSCSFKWIFVCVFVSNVLVLFVHLCLASLWLAATSIGGMGLFFSYSKVLLWFIQHILMGLRVLANIYCIHTHTNTPNAPMHMLAHMRRYMCFLSCALIWFWDQIKFTRCIMAHFTQIMSSGNECDSLRASTLIKGKRNGRSGSAKSNGTEGWVCHFVCPLISQSWSKSLIQSTNPLYLLSLATTSPLPSVQLVKRLQACHVSCFTY